MTVRLSFIRCWLPNLFNRPPDQFVSCFYIPVPVRLPGSGFGPFMPGRLPL